MALTVEQIVEEARHLPASQQAELVDRLTSEFQFQTDTEAAWRSEIRRRLSEIESGQTKGVSGEAVSARVRKIVGR